MSQRRRPASQAASKVARLGVAPSAFLVVEDGAVGATAGTAAGMRVVYHPQAPVPDPAGRAAVARSLEMMGLGYLDLVLIHWLRPVKDRYVETWEAPIEMRSEGLMRSIGASNFNPDHLNRIIAATGVSPVVNQIEVNPKMANRALRAANAARGIVTQGWTPLGEGKTFEFPQIADICARTGKRPAQVTLRWHMQFGHSTVPRAANPAHQAENFDIFDFTLTEDEMAAIATLDWNARCGPDPLFFEWE